MKIVFADLRLTEIKIPVEIQLRNESGPMIQRCKSLPNVDINFHESIAAAGDANNMLSVAAVPVDQPSAELCNPVSHINPVGEPTNNTFMSDADILGLYDRPPCSPRYRKISLANYEGPEFRRCMDLVDQLN